MVKISVIVMVNKFATRLKSTVSLRKVTVQHVSSCSQVKEVSSELYPGHRHLPFSSLPLDILLEIFLHLDVAEVLSLAQTSRCFYNISQLTAIWRNLAFNLMCRSRRISLHDQLTPAALTPNQLRHSVILATAAEQSWLKQKPKCLSCARVVQLRNVDLDHASYVMKFTSRRHLVLPTKNGQLIGWDTRSSDYAGTYDMGIDSVLINVQGEYSTRSLYWITGKMSSDPEHTHNLQLTILRIQFPEPDSSSLVSFEELAQVITPWSLAIELHFLDASRRMFCAVFANSETGTTGLHVMLDWNVGSSYMFDTGVPYEYGRAVIGLNISGDGEHLVLHSEQWGAEIRRTYPIATMRANASVWNHMRGATQPLTPLLPFSEDKMYWEHDRSEFADGDMIPHTVWVLPQWWPTYAGVPLRTSTIILYLALALDGTKTWRAAQHYSYASGNEGEGQAGPCSLVRSVIDIIDPVLISLGHNGLPILAQSFNHLGWIEERVPDELSSRKFSFGRQSWLRRKQPRKRRALKLVTFPDPGVSPLSQSCIRRKEDEAASTVTCDCTMLKAVTLDIPESVLNDVYHMFLDPAAGTITLATEDNELHVYHYGLPPSVSS